MGERTGVVLKQLQRANKQTETGLSRGVWGACALRPAAAGGSHALPPLCPGEEFHRETRESKFLPVIETNTSRWVYLWGDRIMSSAWGRRRGDKETPAFLPAKQ